MSADRKVYLQDTKKAMDAVVGGKGGRDEARKQSYADKAIAEQAKVLNQMIGKSLTDIDTAELGDDYIHTFVATRSLRQHMQTTVSNMMVINKASKAEDDNGMF